MFDLTDCKLCKHICYRVSKARLERAVSQPAMKWTSVLLVSSFLQLNRKSEVMWACCYCFNRRKWALARTEGQFLGSQRTKKGTEARSNRGHSCTSGLLVSRTLNIFSQWPASCCRWFRETNQHNNQINAITDLSLNYWRIFSESKWQLKTNKRNCNERGDFLQLLKRWIWPLTWNDGGNDHKQLCKLGPHQTDWEFGLYVPG